MKTALAVVKLAVAFCGLLVWIAIAMVAVRLAIQQYKILRNELSNKLAVYGRIE